MIFLFTPQLWPFTWGLSLAMTKVFIIIIIISSSSIISQLTCALWQQDNPGLKRGYGGTKKHSTESNAFYPSLSLLTEALLCLSLMGFCYVLPAPDQKKTSSFKYAAWSKDSILCFDVIVYYMYTHQTRIAYTKRTHWIAYTKRIRRHIVCN